MKKLRILSILVIILILAVFAAMMAALITGKNDLFFTEGGVLVALFIIGFVLVTVRKKSAGEDRNKEEEPEGPSS